jgi:long-chain acyl-CoA synthetase
MRYADGTGTAEGEPFTLGEIGVMDDAGYVWVTDRASDMVVSGGVNIYPAEAEKVLASHPAVADVACIGIPHPDLGEALHALVVSSSPVDAADLLAFCRENLTLYKCPRTLSFVETVLRTPVGKLDKRAMRAPYWVA